MKTIDIYTYPDGGADRLAQDDIVSRLQPNGRFTDTYVGDLIEGDQYHIPERELELASDEEILNRFLRGDILFNKSEYNGQDSICIFERDTLDTLEEGKYTGNAEMLGLFRELMTKIIHDETL